MTRPNPDDRNDDAQIDETIRRLMSDSLDTDPPADIQPKVLSRVRRRRAIQRGVYSLAAVAALAAFAFVVSQQFKQQAQDQQVVQHGQDDLPKGDVQVDPNLDDLDFLIVPPPVLSLDLIAEDQYAMLDCLQTLGEERK